MCKKCKKAFRKAMDAYEESDEYCPHCDNHYVSWSMSRLSGAINTISQVINAKTPQAVVGVEGGDARVDARYECPFHRWTKLTSTRRMLKDDRVKQAYKSAFEIDDDDFLDKIG